MSEELVCWRCGAALNDHPLPLSRYAECRSCAAELHCCLLCAFYDTSVAKHCREPIADEVQHKSRANFCGYFTPRPGAFVASDDDVARAARARLDALFGAGDGAGSDSESAATRALEDLFRKPSDAD